MPSTEAGADRRTVPPELLAALGAIAADSILHGLSEGVPLTPGDVPADGLLDRPGASFVTLTQKGRLRGCIGTLERHRPLAEDVAANAYSAAFDDPRFAPLGEGEIAATTLEVAVLTVPEALPFESERGLYDALRPGVDGLIVEHRGRRATYLPSVWDMLPDPQAFVGELLRKAGIGPDVRITELEVMRYLTVKSEPRALVASG